MSDSNLVKPLRGFDPGRDLSVDESFARLLKGRAAGTSGSGAVRARSADAGGNAGREFGSLSSGGPVHSGFAVIDLGNGRSVFAAANLRGELFFFEPSRDGLRMSGKILLHGEFYAAPVFHDGVIYTVSRDGEVFAVDTGLRDLEGDPELLSGRVIWHRKMKKGIFTGAVLTGRVLLVTPLDGVYAFDAFNGPERRIGETLWGLPVNGTLSTPVVNSGMLFIGSEEKKLLAFSFGGDSLKKLWECDLGGICRSKICASDKSSRVAAGTIDGYICAVDRVSGALLWKFETKAPVLSSAVTGDVNGEEVLLFGADNGLFYALDSGGLKLWEFRAGGKIRTEALVHDGRVYFGSEDGSLHALDLESGREVFAVSCAGSIYGKPVIRGGLLYFGSTDGSIHSVYI